MLATSLIVLGCSDFYMPTANTSYRLSVRTMDLGTGPTFALRTQPKGTAGLNIPPARRTCCSIIKRSSVCW